MQHKGRSDSATADTPALGQGVRIRLVQAPSRDAVSVYLNDREPVVVGAGAPSRVVIRGIGVRSAHAKLFMSGGELFVESIATAPVKVNGRPVTGKVRVASGDWVVFGESVFRLEIHHPECAEASREFKPTLENPEARQSAFGVGGGRIEADSKTITVGRLPENSICIPSPMVSRHHARIVYASRRYVIQDLQSTNGTFVNDRRIPQGHAAALRGCHHRSDQSQYAIARLLPRCL